MKLSKLTFLITLTLVFVFSTAVHAQSHETAKAPSVPKSTSVQLGDKTIVIPDPEGYEEGTSQFPRIKDLFQATEAPSNDMLLAHLPASECATLRGGGMVFLNRYTKVSVLKAAREIVISDADMTGTVAEFRRNGTKLLNADGPVVTEVMKNAGRGLSKLESKEIGLDVTETRHLGEFDVRPQVYSVLTLMMLKVDSEGKQEVRPVLMSLTFLKVRQRILYVNVYHKMSSTAALKTELKPAMTEVTKFATKWVNEILAANRADQ
jgi:hypothetical protein